MSAGCAAGGAERAPVGLSDRAKRIPLPPLPPLPLCLLLALPTQTGTYIRRAACVWRADRAHAHPGRDAADAGPGVWRIRHPGARAGRGCCSLCGCRVCMLAVSGWGSPAAWPGAGAAEAGALGVRCGCKEPRVLALPITLVLPRLASRRHHCRGLFSQTLLVVANPLHRWSMASSAWRRRCRGCACWRRAARVRCAAWNVPCAAGARLSWVSSVSCRDLAFDPHPPTHPLPPPAAYPRCSRGHGAERQGRLRGEGGRHCGRGHRPAVCDRAQQVRGAGRARRNRGDERRAQHGE